MALLLGKKVLDDNDDIVEASSMAEACKMFDDEELNYSKPDYQPEASEFVWWCPSGYEGPMVVRTDLIGSQKETT